METIHIMLFIFVNFNFCDLFKCDHLKQMSGKLQDNMHCKIPFLHNKCICTYICVQILCIYIVYSYCDKGKILEGITLSQGIVADIKWTSEEGVYLLILYTAKWAFKIILYVLLCLIMYYCIILHFSHAAIVIKIHTHNMNFPV